MDVFPLRFLRITNYGTLKDAQYRITFSQLLRPAIRLFISNLIRDLSDTFLVACAVEEDDTDLTRRCSQPLSAALLEVARTSYRQLFTCSLRPPVQGG